MLTQNGSNVAGTPGRHMGSGTTLVLRSDVGDGGAFILQWTGPLDERLGWPENDTGLQGWALPLKAKGAYMASRGARGTSTATAVATTTTDIGPATAAGTSTATAVGSSILGVTLSEDRTVRVPWENRVLDAKGANVLLYWPQKDPDELCDFSIDWEGRIGSGDTIQTSTWTVTGAGLTVASSGISGTITTAWLQAGTVGTEYRVTNRITTSAGRSLDQTCVLRVANG